jgi:hypothetical protein
MSNMKIHDMEVPIYETPVPHILWADLKLALTKNEYEQLAMKSRPFDYPVMSGLLVEDVKRYLTKKWK